MFDLQNVSQVVYVRSLRRILVKEAVLNKSDSTVFKRLWVFFRPYLFKPLLDDWTAILNFETQIGVQSAKLKWEASYAASNIHNQSTTQ
jgi:hypothetical protein